MLNEPCDGTRLSWGGLNNSDLRGIYGLRHPSKKTVIIRMPHQKPYGEPPLVTAGRGDRTLLWSSAMSGSRNLRRRVGTCRFRRSRLQNPSLSSWTRTSRRRAAFNQCRSAERESLDVPPRRHLVNFVHRECPRQNNSLMPAENHGHRHNAAASGRLQTEHGFSTCLPHSDRILQLGCRDPKWTDINAASKVDPRMRDDICL